MSLPTAHNNHRGSPIQQQQGTALPLSLLLSSQISAFPFVYACGDTVLYLLRLRV